MSVKDCIEKVNKAMQKSRLRKSEIKDVLEELDAEAKRLALDGQDYQETIRDLGERFAKFVERQAFEEKRRALLQLKAKQSLKAKFDSLSEQGLSSREAIIAMMVGLRRDGVTGSMNSTAAKQLSRSIKNMNEFVKHLEAENILSLWRSKDHNLQIALLEAVEALNTKGADRPTGDIGRIAEIYVAHQKRARKKLKDAGVDTRELDGFTVTQTHDPSLLQSAGEQAWKDDVRNKLDYKRIFGTDKFNDEDIEAFLDSSYGALVSGVRIRPSASAEDQVTQMLKPRNMAERLAGNRVIHFKSSKDFFDYNLKYGRGSIQESMMFSLRSAGFYSALMDDFGPNPRVNFDNLIQSVKKERRLEKDFDDIKDIDKAGFWQKMAGSDLEALFNNIDGTAFVARDVKGARIAQNVRGWVALSRLGAATISAISDNPIMAHTLANNGINHANGYVKAFIASVSRLPEEERRIVASMIDTYQEIMAGYIGNRMGLFDEQPGKMQEALRLFYKLNLLSWWTNAHKEGVAAALSHNLGLNRGKSFRELDKGLKSQFEQFGITEQEWDAFRAIEPIKVNGKEFMTTELLDDMPEFAELSEKLQSYFVENINTAVVTPGARERAIQNFGQQSGTVGGEFIRTVMLFRSFTVTFGIKVLSPAMRAAGNGDVMNIASLMIGMTAFGGVAMAAKDVYKGRDPSVRFNAAQETPAKAFKYWSAMALQGGGLGIYGDFLFGKYNRVGGSLTQTLAGPVYGGMVSDIGRIYSEVTDAAIGEKKLGKLGASVVGAAKNYVPGGNLPYVAPALNYLAIYQLQEALNPGYLRRMERRLEREQGIKFIEEPIDLRPSSVAGQ